uniref:NADH-ubiquinone oxidoreductase chain 5 n=1 Tax=Gastroclonium compressum TaxID=1852973 RepID=A0A173FZR0_GASCM|nr:NADH dehydrogenase subunit 5 [Coeloseira compressa]
MYILILVFPLIGALISGFCGRWLGYYGSSIFTMFCIILTTLFSYLAFYEIGFCGTVCYITLFPWISSSLVFINWSFLFDSVTVVMLVIVTTISSLVHFYSISYMDQDPHFSRFMAFLEIFTFFMLVLVTSDNLVQMFLGWEGVGLASYLLVNFWFTRLAANQSAIKALIVNRVGDFGLTLAIFSIFYVFKSVDYLTIFSVVPLVVEQELLFFNYSINVILIIGTFLFLGAVGKSAQLGLHTWLPDAMEGPTPVSALIHAATMVTAGVFLMIRFSPVTEFSKEVLLLMIIFGSLTAFFASMTGLFQNDLKRVIAYSTCSQLGYMIFACGMSAYHVSLFHLVNHAFFKALLFLGAGSAIHALGDEQDLRRMGSLQKFLPITYSSIFVGSLALAGFPFLTGFYSKDFILEITHVASNTNLGMNSIVFSCWLGNMAAFCTVFYSFRLLFFTFLNGSNLSRVQSLNLHESSIIILIPLLILIIASIFIGYFLKDFFIGLGSDFWKNSIFILPFSSNFLEAEWLQVSLRWLPFILSILSFFLAFFLNIVNFRFFVNYQIFNLLIFLINKKWYWDILYSRFLILPILKFGYWISFRNLDRGFIELIGPYGVPKFISKLSFFTRNIQSGYISHYLFFMILGLCVFLFFITQTIFDIYLIIFLFILSFFI